MRVIRSKGVPIIMRMGLIATLVLFLGNSFLSAEITYHFEKGMTLIYKLELDSEFHSDPNNRNHFIPFHSSYDLRFFVLDTKPNGEACIAMTSHLDSAQLVADSPNLETMDEKDLDAYKDWMADFEKADSAAVVLDRYGNIIKGRMVWPEATCYNLPKILEGISLQSKRDGSPLGGRFQIDNTIAETESHEGKSYTILRSQNRLLDLALLFDNQSRLPLRLQAKYAYKTFGTVFAESLTFRLVEIFHHKNGADFLGDVSMMSAIIQAALLTQSYNLDPEFVRKALSSKESRLRRVAASYCSFSDVLNGFGFFKEEKDDILKLCLAKAAFRWKEDRSQLEYLSKKSTQEIRVRAQRVLTQKQSSNEGIVSCTLDSLQKLLLELSEKEAYQMVREVSLPTGRQIPHLGPRPFSLLSGVNGDRIFHYNVYVPYDYDPEELYPCLIELSGGNGYSESVFLQAVNIVPDNYILVSPDADYGMWWGNDQIQMFDDLFDRIFRDYSIDPDRIYLHGFSNGGIATFLYGFHHPDRLAAVASMEGISRLSDGSRGVETEMSLNMRNSPILILHGDRDNVISIEPNRKLVDFLSRNRIPHKFIELRGVGHSVSFGSYHKKVMDFFQKHKRNPAPQKLNLVVDDMRYNRNFWIRVDEKRDPKERARVKAEIKKDQFILKTKNVKKISLLLNDFHYDSSTFYEVKVNNKIVFQGSLKLDPEILLESLNTEKDVARLYGVRLSFDID
jgi:predicted esterase